MPYSATTAIADTIRDKAVAAGLTDGHSYVVRELLEAIEELRADGELVDLADVTGVTGTGTVVVMQGSPTITTPTIASFSGAQHNHQDAAGGASLDAAAIGSGTLADARVAESNVTQHEAALSQQHLNAKGPSGTTAISGATLVPVDSAVAQSDAGDWTIDAVNEEITFEVSGTYLVLCNVTTDADSTTRSKTKAYLSTHDGVSWTAHAHTLGYMYNRTSTEGADTCTLHMTVAATGGTTKIRAQAAEDTGSAVIVNSSCSWTIARLGA